ncbi:MAG: DUF2339 domain-containing protein, partial [Granulosicoccaceae bacterium]
FKRLREHDEIKQLGTKALERQHKDIADIKARLERLEETIEGGTVPTEVPEEVVRTAAMTSQPVEAEKTVEPVTTVEPEPQRPPTSEILPEPVSAPKPVEPGLEEAPGEAVPLPAAPRQKRSEEEWEALVGGSWLNKVGVLVLVIGLALFLGYSLKYFGPGGRVAIGFAVSLAMLFSGVWLERRAIYKNYGRGLIGGGWAGLYFTTYAMYGLEAARIIDDPLLVMYLLGVIAAGMIVHSLRYHSEVVTGIAFFVGFVTLIISPVTSFSVGASIPIAAALVIITYRFSWSTMMIIGMIFTYGIFALRFGSALTASEMGNAGFATSQAILGIYWLLFEGFDLADLRRRSIKPAVQQTLFPLNACGFIGVSLLYWPGSFHEHLDIFFALVSLAYLASTLLRSWIRPPSAFPKEVDTLSRALRGGYEAAITVASVLAIVAIFLKFTGTQVIIALLLEAELLFLSGLLTRQPFLRTLASIIFLLPVIRFILVDIQEAGQVSVAGMDVQSGTPVGLLITATFYINRLLLARAKEDKTAIDDRWVYSSAGTAILALLLAIEMPLRYLGIGWLILVLPLLESGLRKEFFDLRLISYAAAVLAFTALASVNILGIKGVEAASPWLVFGLGSLLTYAGGVRLHLHFRQHAEDQRIYERDMSFAAGTVLLATLLWHILPGPLVAVGWGIVALVLIELGTVFSLSILRAHGHLLLGAAFVRLFLANFTLTGESAGISHRLLTVTPFIVLYYQLSGQLKRAALKATQARWESGLARLYLYAPVILAAVLLRFELGRSLAVVGWSVLFLILLHFGLRHTNRDLRLQAHALAAITFVRCWATNFDLPDTFWALQGRLVTAIVVITAFFAAHLLSPRHPQRTSIEGGSVVQWLNNFDLHARAFFAGMGSVLLAVLLYHEVSAHLLTVAWALEGITLLVIGFARGERMLRLSGLLLLIICIFKVFIYDFRELDPVFRILSFIVLGLLLLGASMIYTRYREQLKRYF